jgi:hypothetical protein
MGSSGFLSSWPDVLRPVPGQWRDVRVRAAPKGWRWGFSEDKLQPLGLSTCGQVSSNNGSSSTGLSLYGKNYRNDLDIPALLRCT